MNLKPIFSIPTGDNLPDLLSKFYYKRKMNPLTMINLQGYCDITFKKETIIRVNYTITMWKDAEKSLCCDKSMKFFDAVHHIIKIIIDSVSSIWQHTNISRI